MAEQRVYVTMADGNTAGSIVMQRGERVAGDHRTTNGATYAEVQAALAAAGHSAPAEPEEPAEEPQDEPEAQAEVFVEPEEDDEEPDDE